jgi:hypothetical protein
VLSSSEITAGESVYATSTLAGDTPDAGGKVTYYYFTGDLCSVGAVQVGSPVTVTGGSVQPSTPQQFDTAGSYSWKALYDGDLNNNRAESACEPLTVSKTNPSVSIRLYPNATSVYGSVKAQAFLVGLSPTAGGNVTYEYFPGSICAGTNNTIVSVNDVMSGRVPHSTTQAIGSAGSYSWKAFYSGDQNNSPATSPCERLTVRRAFVTALLPPGGLSSITVGGSVVFTASLSTSIPNAGGKVTYYYFASGSCSGIGVQIGSPVTVSGGSVPHSAPQQFNTTGTYNWYAVYSGDPNHNGATSECGKLTVSRTSPTITLSVTPSTVLANQQLTASATVSGFRATGRVDFYYFSDIGCTQGRQLSDNDTIVNGVASIPERFDTAGRYYLHAEYSGDRNNLPKTSGCVSLAVNEPDVSISIALSVVPLSGGHLVTVSANLSGAMGAAGGNVTYALFSGSICSGNTVTESKKPVQNGVIPSLEKYQYGGGGNYSWNAAYSWKAASGIHHVISLCAPTTVSLGLVGTSLSVTCNPSSVTVGTSTVCIAKVSTVSGATPTGRVYWSSNSTGKFSPPSCTVRNGACSMRFTPTSTPISSTLLTANYIGDSKAQKFPSVGTFPLKVTMKTSTTVVSCRPLSVTIGSKNPIMCKATVKGYGKPEGSVTWTQTGAGAVSFSVEICTLNKGSCSVTLTGTLSGAVTVAVTYGGDSNDKGNNSLTVTLTVSS